MQFIFYLPFFSQFSILLRLFHFVQCKQTIVDEDDDGDLAAFAYDVFVQRTSDSSILTCISFFSV